MIETTEDQAARDLSAEYLDGSSSETVLARLNQLTSPEFRQKVLLTISWLLSYDGKLEDRLFFARLIEDVHERDDNLQIIASDHVLQNNLQDALSIAESIQSENKRDFVWKEVALRYAWSADLENALTLAQKILPFEGP